MITQSNRNYFLKQVILQDKRRFPRQAIVVQKPPIKKEEALLRFCSVQERPSEQYWLHQGILIIILNIFEPKRFFCIIVFILLYICERLYMWKVFFSINMKIKNCLYFKISSEFISQTINTFLYSNSQSFCIINRSKYVFTYLTHNKLYI